MLRVMSLLLLLSQLCLTLKYLLLFWEFVFLLLEVVLLLPEHVFLLMECLMGHLMGFRMDLIIDPDLCMNEMKEHTHNNNQRHFAKITEIH